MLLDAEKEAAEALQAAASLGASRGTRCHPREGILMSLTSKAIHFQRLFDYCDTNTPFKGVRLQKDFKKKKSIDFIYNLFYH